MKIISDPKKMFLYSSSLRKRGYKIGFVPTMGALHEGHTSLIRIAKKYCDKVIVSIFVNPIQFGPKEDYKRYPRNIKKDIQILKKEKVDVLFYPTVKQMFSKDFSTFVEVDGKFCLSKKLCGISRPGHFRGVATIVLKLFNIVFPDIAVFGQKDYQQQLIIKKMVKDLNLNVKIITGSIVREKDGLAKSSRNSYLSKEQRLQAPILYQSLLLAKKMVIDGEKDASKIIAKAKKFILQNSSFKIDYFSIVNPKTLENIKKVNRPVLIAVAAYLGKTRLIDNLVV